MSRFHITVRVVCLLIVIVCFAGLGTNQLIDEYVLQVSDENEIETVLQEDAFSDFTVKKRILKNSYWLKKTMGVSVTDEEMLNIKNNPKVVSFQQQTRLERFLRGTVDPEWVNMWYLNGNKSPDMKVQNTWEAYQLTGYGIVVAVVDDGLETTHPDLIKYVNTEMNYDAQDNDDDPTPSTGQSHGTICAGIIVAEKDNGICVVGVSNQATIIGIRLLGDTTSDAMEAAALNHQLEKVDIYCNNWGPKDGSGFDGPKEVAQQALENGVLTGRGGKGAIYVWSAGNGGLDDNCNADGYVNSIYTIAITSLDYDQQPASYAEVCSPALATVYGGGDNHSLISTTTEGNCVNTGLQGTSFASSLASGIIALTLEINPDLSWRDVQHLIVRTSKKHETVETASGIGWVQNGAGLYCSHRFGFGVLDAEELTTFATEWKNVPNQISFKSDTLEVLHNLDSDHISRSNISITDCDIKYLEHVIVGIHFDVSWAGALELKLESPETTASYLLTNRTDDQTYQVENMYWEFMSVHFWGENTKGDWILTAKTVDDVSTGIISKWVIQFYGTATIPKPYLWDDCGDPGTLSQAEITIPDSTFGVTVTYECEMGYKISGNGTITCGEYGVWTDHTLTCTTVDCRHPEQMPHAYLAVTTTTSGSTAIFTCHTGYHFLAGGNTIWCQGTGYWSQLEYTCELVDCESPTTVVNTRIEVTTTTFDSMATYYCKTGYTPFGSGSVICLASSLWTNPTLTCTIVECWDPPDVVNRTVVASSTTYGSVWKYSCPSGHVPTGSDTIVCNEDGNWSNNTLICTYVDCGTPDIWMDTLAPIFTSTTFAGTASYTCKPGLTVLGNGDITCQADGSWSKLERTCFDASPISNVSLQLLCACGFLAILLTKIL